MSKPRILFSIPTRHHVEIALDEMEGMQDLGYECRGFAYAAREGVTSTLGRLKVIVQNAFQLVRTAYRFKPDIIYFNSRLEAVAGMRDFITISIFRAFYHRRVKFVLKSHGSDMSVLQGKSFALSKVILPYLKKHISGWLFLSSEEKYKLIENGYLPADRIFVTKNIVRVGQFKPDAHFKQSLNIPSDHKVLLFVGRLIPEKGIYEVLHAFAKIKDSYKAVLLVVGWGSKEENLKQLCIDLGIQNKVTFTGFVPEQQVVAYYTNCDALVFPTYFPEGFPMALFNSVAAGLPVITTKTRAATDYLSEPENCLWVEPQNSDSVSDALQRLLQSDRLMAEMKINNLQKGKSFNRKQVCAELADKLNIITEK